MSKFITKEEMNSVISEYQMVQITTDDDVINHSILAAIAEATSFLNAQYDCNAIFNATGDGRNVLVLEHCKSIALWYLIRKCNADIYFDRVKAYYNNAIEWFKMVAGVGSSSRQLAPDLPIKQTDGVAQTRFRGGSLPKFSHNFD